MENLTVTSVTLVLAEADEAPGMPTFNVRGSWKSHPFEYNVSVELDGREAEWEHVSGRDSRARMARFGRQFIEDEDKIFEAIFATDDYKRLLEKYGS